MTIKEVENKTNLSPMMKQYIDCKKNYMDCFLFYRLGDFYELFFEDAITVSKLLELALTGRACGLKEKAPMCGIPARALDVYASKLVEMGYKVAVGEQLENPNDTSGIVKRDVVRIITPGTKMDSEQSNNFNNYLACIYKESMNDSLGFSYVDILTGTIYTTKLTKDELLEELSKIKPTEVIGYNFNFSEEFQVLFKNLNTYYSNITDEFFIESDILYEYFHVNYLNSLFMNKSTENDLIKASISALLNYISYTQKKIAHHIDNIIIYNVHKYMILDSFTRDSLELTKNIKGLEKEGSLFYILDKTSTAMGSRLLKRMIEEPLIDKEEIENRLNLVEEFVNNPILRENISKILNKVYDLERLCGKIAFERINPRELINLKNSIELLPELKQIIEDSETLYLKKFLENFNDLSDVFNLINESIIEDCSISITEGNIIKSSYNETLSHYRNILEHMGEKISEIEQKERDKYHTKNIKISKNNSDGYYIEITKNTLKTIELDDDYKKIKDLINCSRFTCSELKKLEHEILEAENKSTNLEYNLFVFIRNQLLEHISIIKETARKISYIDVFLSLSEVAIKNNYVRPSLNTVGDLEIIEGRHPIVEKMNDCEFISNNTIMNHSDNLIHLITGPNMSGKSTYMRQIVLITLMAQIGSFVPCKKANISICDRLFTRIGASDNLSKGESTFMVEMNEVSQILSHATTNSLIILDEVGRGTSTYDGISLAWSIIEYIQKNIQCHTLFATHYFELTKLTNSIENIKNYTVQIEESAGEVKFLRKIIEGCADKSYGIYVAGLAKLPMEVICRASEILKILESEKQSFEITEKEDTSFITKLLEIDLNNSSPLEVMNVLNKLQIEIKKEKGLL